MGKKPIHHTAGDEKTDTDILINVLLDRSGSMSGKEGDVIGNFNSFIKEQRELPGTARVSLVLFDDKYQEVYVDKDIKDVPELDSGTYVIRGNTALLDAVGKLIGSVDSIKDKPNKILFLINTDGFENASREFTRSQIKEMVKERQDNHDWQFLFIGAGVDAFTESTGAGLGLKSWQTFTSSAGKSGMTNISAYSGSYTTNYRTTGLTGEELVAATLDNVDFVPDPDAPVTAGNTVEKKKKKVTTSK